MNRSCRLCGFWRPRCERCAPTTVDAALRVAEEAAAFGEPVPDEAALVLLSELDQLHARRPGVMVLLMLHEPERSRP